MIALPTDFDRNVHFLEAFDEVFASPHGSFSIRKLSKHVYVCISSKQSDWQIVDYPKPFILYIGWSEPEINRWVNRLAANTRFYSCNIRPAKRLKFLGFSTEWKVEGISVKDAIFFGNQDRQNYGYF